MCSNKACKFLMEGQKKDKKLQDGNIASSNLVLVVEGRGGPG